MASEAVEKVVRLTMDNEQYKQKITESMNTMTKLAKDQQNVLENSNKQLNNIQSNTSIVTQAIGTMVGNVLTNFVEKGLKMAHDAIFKTQQEAMEGFQEYELKINAIQTILMSAKTNQGLPVTLAEVNEQLDMLNRYADQTIYSFSDMTSNIGKFTNAGVGLELSVQAIQGISNAAALAGANAQQASHAMYNFAQALASGYVKLIDWKSIENANMATVDFKNQLLESAVAAGTLEKALDGTYTVLTTGMTGSAMKDTISATKNFNDSLQYQWMTTDVLTTTLAKYASMEEEIGIKANAAARSVRTFSQMMSTVRESVASGWAASWELISGNYEEATAFWTHVKDVIDSIIERTTTRRNTFLQSLVDQDAVIRLREVVLNVLKIYEILTKSWRKAWSAAFPVNTANTITKILTKVSELTAGFLYNLETGENLEARLFTAFVGIRKVIETVTKPITFSLGLIKKGMDAIADTKPLAIANAGFEKLKSIISSFDFSIFTKGFDKVKSGFTQTSFTENSSNIEKAVFIIKKAFTTLIEFLDGALGVIVNFFNTLGININTVKDLMALGVDFFSAVKMTFPEITSLGDTLLLTLDKIVLAFMNLFGKKDDSKNETVGFKTMSTALSTSSNEIESSVDKVKKVLGSIDWGKVIPVAILSIATIAIFNLATSVTTLATTSANVTKSISTFFTTLTGMLKTIDKSIGGIKKSWTEKLLEFSISVVLIAGSIAVLAQTDTKKAMIAVGELSIILLEFAGLSFLMSKASITAVSMSGFTGAIVGISGAILILSLLGKERVEAAKSALMGILAIFTLMGTVAAMLGKDKMDLKAVLNINGYATALIGIIVALMLLKNLDIQALLPQIALVLTLVVVLGAISKALTEVSKNGSVKSAPILSLTIGVVALVAALAILNHMDMDRTLESVKLLGLVLAGLTAALVLIQGPTIAKGSLEHASTAINSMMFTLIATTLLLALLNSMDLKRSQESAILLGVVLVALGAAFAGIGIAMKHLSIATMLQLVVVVGVVTAATYAITLAAHQIGDADLPKVAIALALFTAAMAGMLAIGAAIPTGVIALLAFAAVLTAIGITCQGVAMLLETVGKGIKFVLGLGKTVQNETDEVSRTLSPARGKEIGTGFLGGVTQGLTSGGASLKAGAKESVSGVGDILGNVVSGDFAGAAKKGISKLIPDIGTTITDGFGGLDMAGVSSAGSNVGNSLLGGLSGVANVGSLKGIGSSLTGGLIDGLNDPAQTAELKIVAGDKVATVTSTMSSIDNIKQAFLAGEITAEEYKRGILETPVDDVARREAENLAESMTLAENILTVYNAGGRQNQALLDAYNSIDITDTGRNMTLKIADGLLSPEVIAILQDAGVKIPGLVKSEITNATDDMIPPAGEELVKVYIDGAERAWSSANFHNRVLNLPDTVNTKILGYDWTADTVFSEKWIKALKLTSTLSINELNNLFVLMSKSMVDDGTPQFKKASEHLAKAGIYDPMTGEIRQVPLKTQEAMQKIIEEFKSAKLNAEIYDSVYGIADKISKGYTNGSAGFFATNSKMLQDTKKTIEAMKKVTLERSPSKVFKDIGYNIVRGYELGLETFPQVSNSIVDETRNAIGLLGDIINDTSLADTKSLTLNLFTDGLQTAMANAMTSLQHIASEGIDIPLSMNDLPTNLQSPSLTSLQAPYKQGAPTITNTSIEGITVEIKGTTNMSERSLISAVRTGVNTALTQQYQLVRG